MKAELLSTNDRGDELWVDRKHPDGRYSGFIIKTNRIRREVADIGLALSTNAWPTKKNIDKYFQRREPKKPKAINYPDFDRPIAKPRKNDDDDTSRPR